MRTGACFLLLAVLTSAHCLASYEITAQDAGGITLSFDFSTAQSSRDRGGNWIGCRVPGYVFSLGESLGLEIPADIMLFAVPPAGDVRLELRNQVVRESHEISDKLVSHGRGTGSLDLPAAPAELRSSGFMRNQRVAAVRVSPVAVDRDSGSLTVYDRFELRLVFEQPSDPDALRAGSFRTGRGGRRDSFESVYMGLLENYEQGREWRRRPQAGLRSAAEDYFNSSPNWVRVKVNSTGIHRITGSELADAGVSLSGIDPETVRLYGGGGLPLKESLLESNPEWMAQMTVKVCDGGDGSFDARDSLIFYGLGMYDWTNLFDPNREMDSYFKSFFSDYNYYWLTWGRSFSEDRREMGYRDLIECNGCEFYQPPSFYERVHVELDALHDVSIRADDGWYWRPLRLGETVRLNPDTPFPDSEREGSIKVRVADWHGGTECIGHYYRLQVGFNGADVADSMWQAVLSWRGVVDIVKPVDPLDQDSQQVSLYMSRDIPAEVGGSACGKLYLAWYEVNYWREFVAMDDVLHFFSPDTSGLVKYDVGGYATSSIYAFDVTDQYNVTELRGFGVSGATNFAVSFYDSAAEGAPRRYALVGAGSLLKPAALSMTTIRDIRNAPGNDYVVITHEDLLPAADAIADYHGGEVVTVEEIYNEFAWGVPDVTAIRDFLRWRLDTGRDLYHVLLLGDATWDYKSNLAIGIYPNYVPSYERRYLPPVGDPYCTDDFFGYLTPNDADGTPVVDSVDYFLDAAISRLPAPSPGDADLLVAKAIAYGSDPPQGRWRNRICLVADDDRQGASCDPRPHTMDMEAVNLDAYPGIFERIKVYLTEYTVDDLGKKPTARADFIETLNSGVLMANFVGHGDETRLADEEVLNPSSIPLIDTGRREFYFIAASCNVSRFDEPTLSSMCEDLIKRPGGGTIGSLASTHFCIPQRNKELNLNFVESLFPEGAKHPVRPVADAMVVAKARTAGNGLNYRNNSEMFALIGDPALEICSPELTIEFDRTAADTLRRKGVYSFSGRVKQAGTVATWLDGVIDVIVNEAEDTTGYMACTGYYDYSLPGREIFRGQAGVSGGEFEFSLLISANAVEGPRGQLRGTISGPDVSGSGLLDSLIIYDQASSTDNEGPSIEIVSAHGPVGPGDTLTVREGERLRLNLADSSGVALQGKGELPGVSIKVDEGERISLADSVYSELGDFRKSHVYFEIPAITPGAHDLEVAAYDNLNKLSKENFVIIAEAPESAEKNIAYVFPNPVNDFCYIVCEYERDLEVEVSMFTVSGREIWKHRAPDARSYHEIPWRCRDARGDVVANGTYLVQVEARDPDDPSFSLKRNCMIAVIR